LSAFYNRPWLWAQTKGSKEHSYWVWKPLLFLICSTSVRNFKFEPSFPQSAALNCIWRTIRHFIYQKEWIERNEIHRKFVAAKMDVLWPCVTRQLKQIISDCVIITCQNLRSFQASLVTDITFSWFNSWAVITLSNFLIRCLSFMRLNKTTCPTKKQQKASLLDFDLWKNIRLNNNGPQCSTDKLFWRKLFLERNAICGFDSVVSKMLCSISSHPS